jgi:hypothetical protein
MAPPFLTISRNETWTPFADNSREQGHKNRNGGMSYLKTLEDHGGFTQTD